MDPFTMRKGIPSFISLCAFSTTLFSLWLCLDSGHFDVFYSCSHIVICLFWIRDNSVQIHLYLFPVTSLFM